MTEELYDVFVYGTLLVGESNHHIAKPYIRQVKKGKVRGFLYHVGSYPAIILDSKGMEILGEWLTVTKEGLRQMDLLEEYDEWGTNNEYHRVKVSDINLAHEGFVYVYSNEQVKQLDLIESGSWRIFVKKNVQK